MKKGNPYKYETLFADALFVSLVLSLLFLLFGCNESINGPGFVNPDELIYLNEGESISLGKVNDYEYEITLINIKRVMNVERNETNLTLSTNAGTYSFDVNQNTNIDLLFDNNYLLTLDIQGVYDNQIIFYVYYSGDYL